MKLITNAEYDAMEAIEYGLGERMFKLQEENKRLKFDIEVLKNMLIALCAEMLLDDDV